MNTLPSITLGGPIRDRSWTLSYYLRAIEMLDYPRELIRLVWLANNCKDNTVALLNSWAAHQSGYREILVEEIEYPDYQPIRDPDRAGERAPYWHYARVRNKWLELALDAETEYLASVDSDVIVPTDFLRRLAPDDFVFGRRKDIISALVCNDQRSPHPEGKGRSYNVMRPRQWNAKERDAFQLAGEPIPLPPRDAEHVHNLPQNKIIRCFVTGAAYLIHRRVIDAGVRYDHHRQGEDIAFCTQAQDRGFLTFCNTGVRCVHLMDSFTLLWATQKNKIALPEPQTEHR